VLNQPVGGQAVTALRCWKTSWTLQRFAVERWMLSRLW